MEVIQSGIEGLVEIRPRIFGDQRGWFMESFNQKRYEEHIHLAEPFVQDNISSSEKGILRGLHFQKPPFAQAKLVMVLKGKALDVALDLRRSSPTYGKHFKVILDAQAKNQLFIPRGFAHGFVALEDETLFAYKCDNVYSQESEMTLKWDDSDLGIDWGIREAIISDKDAKGTLFKDFTTPFD